MHKYKIGQLLGSGGQGSVYNLSEDLDAPDNKLAIKISTNIDQQKEEY